MAMSAPGYKQRSLFLRPPNTTSENAIIGTIATAVVEVVVTTASFSQVPEFQETVFAARNKKIRFVGIVI